MRRLSRRTPPGVLRTTHVSYSNGVPDVPFFTRPPGTLHSPWRRLQLSWVSSSARRRWRWRDRGHSLVGWDDVLGINAFDWTICTPGKLLKSSDWLVVIMLSVLSQRIDIPLKTMGDLEGWYPTGCTWKNHPVKFPNLDEWSAIHVIVCYLTSGIILRREKIVISFTFQGRGGKQKLGGVPHGTQKRIALRKWRLKIWNQRIDKPFKSIKLTTRGVAQRGGGDKINLCELWNKKIEVRSIIVSFEKMRCCWDNRSLYLEFPTLRSKGSITQGTEGAKGEQKIWKTPDRTTIDSSDREISGVRIRSPVNHQIYIVWQFMGADETDVVSAVT